MFGSTAPLLMFSATWPESAQQADLARNATHAFDVLRGVLRRMHGDAAALRETVELDALYIWSTMHGLAGVMNGPCIEKLDLEPKVLRQAVRHAMDRMGVGLARKIEEAVPARTKRAGRAGRRAPGT